MVILKHLKHTSSKTRCSSQIRPHDLPKHVLYMNTLITLQRVRKNLGFEYFDCEIILCYAYFLRLLQFYSGYTFSIISTYFQQGSRIYHLIQ